MEHPIHGMEKAIVNDGSFLKFLIDIQLLNWLRASIIIFKKKKEKLIDIIDKKNIV